MVIYGFAFQKEKKNVEEGVDKYAKPLICPIIFFLPNHSFLFSKPACLTLCHLPCLLLGRMLRIYQDIQILLEVELFCLGPKGQADLKPR